MSAANGLIVVKASFHAQILLNQRHSSSKRRAYLRFMFGDLDDYSMGTWPSLSAYRFMIKLGQSGKCLFPSWLDAYSFTHHEVFVKWYLLKKQSFLVQKYYVFGTKIDNDYIIKCCI